MQLTLFGETSQVISFGRTFNAYQMEKLRSQREADSKLIQKQHEQYLEVLNKINDLKAKIITYQDTIEYFLLKWKWEYKCADVWEAERELPRCKQELIELQEELKSIV